ncbi:MAG: energy transducer TonB [Gemmatimonadales bacterium]
MATVLIGASNLDAQDSLPPLRAILPTARSEIRVSWPLIDFVVVADTAFGVRVFMAPSLRSAQGAEHSAVHDLSLDPMYVHQWTAVAEQGIQQPWPDPRPSTPMPVAAAMPALGGGAYLVLGKDPSPNAQAPFLLIYHDSVSHAGWTAYASQNQVSQLLIALDDVASRSRYDPAARTRADSLGRVEGPREVQQVPRLLSMHRLVFPSSEHQEGRVWVEYVVGTQGLVEAPTIEIILSDGPGFTDAVRAALGSAVYDPGRVDGAAVRVLCFQVFTFRLRY